MWAGTSEGNPVPACQHPAQRHREVEPHHERAAEEITKRHVWWVKAFGHAKTRAIDRCDLLLPSHPDALVFRQFAGSGTTAHAVLKANAPSWPPPLHLDEGEDYADRLTGRACGYSHQLACLVGT